MAIPVELLARLTADNVPAPVKLVPAVLAIPFAPIAELVAPAVLAATAATPVEPIVLTEPVVESEAALVTPVEPDVGLVVPVVAAGDELDGLGEEVVFVTLSIELVVLAVGAVVLVEPVVLGELAAPAEPVVVEDDSVDEFTVPIELPVVG